MSGASRGALVAFLCLAWGSTWLAIKIGLEDLPPFLSAGVRFLVAVAVLAALSLAAKVPFPRGARLHAGLAAAGLLQFVVSYGAVYWGEQYIPSGLSAVLFATYPLLVLVLAHGMVEGERITARKAVGVGLGLVGVALIFRSDLAVEHPLATVAAGVTLLSPLASGLTSVGIKRWGQAVHPYTLTTLPMAYGAVGLLAISLAAEDPAAARWSAEAYGSVVYLALVGSVAAFVVYYRVLKEVTVSALALISYVFPVVAVALGWVVLGERLTGWTLAGAALVVAGIAVATARRRRVRSPARSPDARPGPT